MKMAKLYLYGALEGKANRRNPANGSAEESDGDVVPGKLVNKGEQPPGGKAKGSNAKYKDLYPFTKLLT